MKLRALFIALSAAAIVAGSRPAEAQFRRNYQPSRQPATSGVNPIHEKSKTEAQAAYEKGEFQRTIDLTSSVLRSNPRDDVAYYLRASARVDLGLKTKSTEAVRGGIADAREAIRYKGKTNSIYYIPYFHGMTTLADLEDRPEHAEVVVTYATKTIGAAGVKQEDRAHLTYHRGRAHVVLHNLDKAIADFQAAIRDVPDVVAFHMELADAYAAAGQPDKATETYKMALSRFPDAPVVYNNRGMFLLREGKSNEAVADFTQALALDQKFYFALTNRGFALLKSGDAAAAENDLTASLKLNPDQPRAFGLRASAKLALGRIDEGIADHERATRLDPENPVAWADLGYARYFAGDFPSALKSFDKALALDPERRFLFPWQHLAMARAGQDEAAKSKFADVIQEDATKRDWIDHLLAYLAGQLDDETLIQSVNDKASVKTAQLCEAHFFIAERHSMNGESDVAVEHFRQAVETDARQLAAYRGANFALKRVATSSESK